MAVDDAARAAVARGAARRAGRASCIVRTYRITGHTSTEPAAIAAGGGGREARCARSDRARSARCSAERGVGADASSAR